MQKKKIEIIKKEIDLECYVCDGTGYIKCACENGRLCVGISLTERPVYEVCCVCKGAGKNTCKICKGTGIFKDYIYYHIADGVCFSGDTLK